MLNNVQLIGNLGRDPELRKTQAGDSVASISLATSERWKDRDGGQKEQTEWHRLVLWGSLADIACKHLKKGDKAYFEGKLRTRKWADSSGKDCYATEVQVSKMVMLGGGGKPQEDDKGEPQTGSADARPFDDDIPF